MEETEIGEVGVDKLHEQAHESAEDLLWQICDVINRK
jgi:hypothetical protein